MIAGSLPSRGSLEHRLELRHDEDHDAEHRRPSRRRSRRPGRSSRPGSCASSASAFSMKLGEALEDRRRARRRPRRPAPCSRRGRRTRPGAWPARRRAACPDSTSSAIAPTHVLERPRGDLALEDLEAAHDRQAGVLQRRRAATVNCVSASLRDPAPRGGASAGAFGRGRRARGRPVGPSPGGLRPAGIFGIVSEFSRAWRPRSSSTGVEGLAHDSPRRSSARRRSRAGRTRAERACPLDAPARADGPRTALR